MAQVTARLSPYIRRAHPIEQSERLLSSIIKFIGSLKLLENLMHSCAIPVSDPISPIKQYTFDFFFFNLRESATPTAIGIEPPTIAEE